MHIHPVVPVRDMVVFPGVIAPLFVGGRVLSVRLKRRTQGDTLFSSPLRKIP